MKEKLIVIIPAAGKGTRFQELGKQYPKSCLPYKEVPILVHQINFIKENFSNKELDIRVIVGHQQQKVKYFLDAYNHTDVKLFEQTTLNGLSGAIYEGLNDYTTNDNLLIILGDILPASKFVLDNQFISVKKVPDYSRWCMVEINQSGRVISFIDKPDEQPDTDLAVSGIYYLKDINKVKKLLEEQFSNNEKTKNEFQFSTVLQKLDLHVKFIDVIDFGTLEEYLENRSIKKSRSFNELTQDDYKITKLSTSKRQKIIDEYNWFMNIPDELKRFTPRVYSLNLLETSYTMETIKYPTLRDFYLFISSEKEDYINVFNYLFDYLDHAKLKEFTVKENYLNKIYKKTVDRTKELSDDYDKILINNFLTNFYYVILDSQDIPCVMHGDFCFSNILYNISNNDFRLIDPRGEIFGSHYYEVAKLMHSALFDYDFIDAELYLVDSNKNTVIYNEGKESIKQLFIDEVNRRYNKNEIKLIYYICASLFLSMIPLHAHNKQNQKIYFNIFKTIYTEYCK